MLLYLIIIIICFLLDGKKYRNNKTLYTIGCLVVICFLCFGYMVGSDWRQYERDYVNDYYVWYVTSGEIGSYWIFKIFKSLGVDFWLFTGICKILYFYSILYLASRFTDKKWSVIGVYIIMSDLLAIIISCPFRNMLAVTVANFAIALYLNNKRILSIVLLLLACTFHSAFIVTAAILVSYFFFNKLASRITSSQYVFIYLGLYAIILFTPIFDIIYTYAVPFFGLTDLAEQHGTENMKNFLTIGNVKELILFMLLVVFRNDILKLKGGNILFYYAMFSALGFLLFKCLPVGSRLNILNKFFYAIVFSQLLHTKLTSNARTYLPRFALTICLLSTFYNMYNTYVYIPYSNSIPYILTEHKSLEERTMYNYNAYTERTGKVITGDE